MTITQSITEYAGDVPNKNTMTADEFDVAAEAWVAYQDGLATELNEFADQMNAIATSENAQAAALAAANFVGNWSDQTGSLDISASVYHGGYFWMLLSNLLDVTESEPTEENTDWALIRLDARMVFGAEITDSATLTAAAANRYIEVNKATTVTLTVDSNSFREGDTIILEQAGLGKILIVSASGEDAVTIHGGPQSIKQYTALQLVFKSNHTLTVIGGQEA